MTQVRVAVPVRPSDPPFMQPLASRSLRDTEPRQWHRPWGDNVLAKGYLREAFFRRDANGELCRRLILEPERRSLEASGERGVGGGASWEAIDPFRKQLIIDLTFERRKLDRDEGREDEQLTVGFYCGVLGNGHPGMIDNGGVTGILNLDNDHDLDYFRRKWEPWIECGVLSELSHDAGSPADRWEAAKNLLNDQWERWGLYGVTEAISHGPGFSWLPWQGTPMWCLSRYILNRDPNNLLTWPDDAEVTIMNHPHKRSNGESGLLSHDEIRDFKSRGWGVGSWHPTGDYAVNLPDAGPPPDRDPDEPDPNPDPNPGDRKDIG